jgi:hypothetical protein
LVNGTGKWPFPNGLVREAALFNSGDKDLYLPNHKNMQIVFAKLRTNIGHGIDL